MSKGFTKKTIVTSIQHNVNKWLKTIEDETLRNRVEKSYILTGGAIVSMLLGEKPNDWDIYFNDVDVCYDIAKYYVDKYSDKVRNSLIPEINVTKSDNQVQIFIKSAGVIGENVDTDSYQYFESVPDPEEYINQFLGSEGLSDKETGKYKPVFITSNAISLTDSIQLILRFVGHPETIHKNFDFIHATNYYSETTGLVLKQEALESILSKQLKYFGSKYPIASLFRLRKFIERGWTIGAGEILKISWDISSLDLTDIEVLQDQLTGVDVAYFSQLLNILKNSTQNLDRTYLVELISRIFD